ncbi:unnamed protein product [Urochloa humidicola]
MSPGSQRQAEAEEMRRAWVLLCAVPRILTAPRLPLAGDVELALKVPPRISFLGAGRHIVPRNGDVLPKFQHAYLSDPAPSSTCYPYIAAVEHSGPALVLCASHRADREETPYPNWPRFFLCDAALGTAVELPCADPDRVLYSLAHPGRVGLLRDARHRLVVADLQPVPLADVGYHSKDATLLLHFEGTGKWEMKQLNRPPRDSDFSWSYDGVVAHAGRLWWVDLSYGMLSCDPFSDKPKLLYTPLPSGFVPSGATARRVQVDLDKTCCVRSSGGKLRFVVIQDGGLGLSSAITMWTLTGEGDGSNWLQDYTVPISSLLDDMHLRCEEKVAVPVLAAVDPFDARIVYMWLGTRIVAFNVPGKKLLQWAEPFMVPDHDIPEGEFPSSRLLHAWVLPPALHLQFAADSIGEGQHSTALSIVSAALLNMSILRWPRKDEQQQ